MLHDDDRTTAQTTTDAAEFARGFEAGRAAVRADESRLAPGAFDLSFARLDAATAALRAQVDRLCALKAAGA